MSGLYQGGDKYYYIWNSIIRSYDNFDYICGYALLNLEILLTNNFVGAKVDRFGEILKTNINTKLKIQGENNWRE